MHSAAILLGSLSTLAAAMTIDVTVGGSAGLVFTPNQVTASVGDVINFDIYANHSVAQSSFANPCNPINDKAIFSGFGVKNFLVTVNDTTPIWIYCSQASHCAQGMVFAINPT
jgi:plastocyanin